MKRTWVVFFGCLLLAAPAAMQAQFTYTTNADNTLTITGYSGGGEVDIPATFDGLTVTVIGTNSFAATAITGVTMPTNIAGIDDSAFSGCSSLTNITISDNVTNIGNGAFGDCTNLATVTIPGSVTTIGNFAFILCSSLPSITIPASATTIGEAAFQSCVSLTNLTILDGVTNIGNNAFAFCSQLTTLTIPGSVANIGAGVFQYCAGLTNATIASGVPSIGGSMFQSCQNLASVAIPAGVTNIGNYAFSGTILTSVTIPTSVLGIGVSAFSDTRLASVAIPNGVASIGEAAFAVSSLASVTISQSVTNIGDGAFSSCPNLTNITVSGPNLFYRSVSGVVYDPTESQLLIFPSGLAGNYTISSNVTGIGEGAFAGSILSGVTIPASVTNIASSAFDACLSLTNLFFEGNAPTTDPTAFNGDTKATIYYLPGATGWSSPFAGLPAVEEIAPSLRILASKPNIVISWSTNAANYMLEQTASLSRPVTWSLVTNSITVVGTNNTVTINTASGVRYFALIGTP